MATPFQLLMLALCLFGNWHTMAYAQPGLGQPRGALLYETHCTMCHSTDIHWRDKKLATDWSSLLFQVRRWQANIGLNWSEAEINDVALHLNTLHYRFRIPGRKDLSQDGAQGRL